MNFRQYVCDRLPPLPIAREPEIVDELAQHLADLYRDAIASGLSPDAALARATAAMPDRPQDLAHEIETARFRA